jgi:sulfate permease, SulP family
VATISYRMSHDLTILVLASLFEKLPSATLGAVVIDAMVGLITLADLNRYRRVNRADWVFFMGAGLGILFFGIIQGIVIGVVLSLLLLIARSSRTSVRRLGYDAASGSYHALGRHGPLVTPAGILIARIDGPLFFADADRFRTQIRELTHEAGAPTAVVIDTDAVHLTDTDGADILIQVARELASDGVSVALAQVHPSTLALWRRAGLRDVLGDEAVFDSVNEAVSALGAAPAPVPSGPPAPVRLPVSSRPRRRR